MAKKPNGRANGRVNTHKSNGAPPESKAAEAPAPVTIGEAMRQAVIALGEPEIDTELVGSQMRQLSDLYEDVVRKQTAFVARTDEAKVAKKALESTQALLLERVREFTHPSALPLFDIAQREDDLKAMTSATDA